MTGPMLCTYREDGSFEPVAYFRQVVRTRYRPGMVVKLVEVEDRNMNSHKHFFACLNEAHANLREDMAQQFPTPERLRKWALTFTEFCDVRHYRAHTKSEAVRVAAHLADDPDYCRVEVFGTEVIRYKPLSQAVDAMDSRTFMKSKRAVLEVLAQKLGVPLEDLENAGRAA